VLLRVPMPFRLRDEIDHILSSDRLLSLVVALETALEDQRFDVSLDFIMIRVALQCFWLKRLHFE
jgi:hypothetical protein